MTVPNNRTLDILKAADEGGCKSIQNLLAVELMMYMVLLLRPGTQILDGDTQGTDEVATI
jgi:hypothetical protein